MKPTKDINSKNLMTDTIWHLIMAIAFLLCICGSMALYIIYTQWSATVAVPQ